MRGARDTVQSPSDISFSAQSPKCARDGGPTTPKFPTMGAADLLQIVAHARIALYRMTSSQSNVSPQTVASHRIAPHRIVLHGLAWLRIVTSRRMAPPCMSSHRITSPRTASHRNGFVRFASYHIAWHRISLHYDAKRHIGSNWVS